MLKVILGRTAAVLMFLVVIVLALALPKHTRPSAQTYSPESTDSKIGVAMFKIGRKGSDISMEPLLAPEFKLESLAGDSIESSMIQKCGVYNRVLFAIDMHVAANITVLKCGSNEYGITE